MTDSLQELLEQDKAAMLTRLYEAACRGTRIIPDSRLADHEQCIMVSPRIFDELRRQFPAPPKIDLS